MEYKHSNIQSTLWRFGVNTTQFSNLFEAYKTSATFLKGFRKDKRLKIMNINEFAGIVFFLCFYFYFYVWKRL